MKTMALTLSTLFFLAPLQAENFDPQTLLKGIKETKLIFQCGTEGAEIIFQARERYVKEYSIRQSGEVIEVKGIDSCTGSGFFPAGDYCVEALCIHKEIAPTIPSAGGKQSNVNQLQLKPPSLDTFFNNNG